MLNTKTTEMIRSMLKEQLDCAENPIDISLPPIPPYRGNKQIKLIVLGQDPTIKNAKMRSNIKYTLNLDKNNSLKTYIVSICDSLGISIENVYATNLFKYFYAVPPAKTLHVLYDHLEPNLELLKNELSEFKNIPILTLGEPVLQLLTNERSKVKEFWDYNNQTKATNGNFKLSEANENKLQRNIYPFPHQPSLRKMFYKDTLKKYLNYMKETL